MSGRKSSGQPLNSLLYEDVSDVSGGWHNASPSSAQHLAGRAFNTWAIVSGADLHLISTMYIRSNVTIL